MSTAHRSTSHIARGTTNEMWQLSIAHAITHRLTANLKFACTREDSREEEGTSQHVGRGRRSS
jgi:hypothetical protein